MTRLEQPDETWDDDLKTKFRKCKHIFVLLDDDSFMETSIGDPLSANDYQDRITRFLEHLLEAFPDPTFPIWFFSIFNETPVRAQTETHHCYGTQPHHTLEHPCNRALIDLFQRQRTNEVFGAKNPERIRYLDTTDVSMAILGPRQIDVLAVIALRIYVIVGKQVQEWRQAGQQGLVDGLHRNGTVEPNLDLVHYVWK